LVDPPGATLVIFDNLGWYCDRRHHIHSPTTN